MVRPLLSPVALFVCAFAVASWGQAQVGTPLQTDEGTESAAAKLAEVQKQIDRVQASLTEWQAKSTEFGKAWKEAPSQLKAIQDEIAQLERLDAINIPEGATRDELAVLLAQAQQDLSLARREATELEAKATQRAERRRKIPELLSSASERLRALDASAAEEASPDPEVRRASTRLRDLKRNALEAEIQSYQNELGSYEARGVLLTRRRDRAKLRIAYQEALTEKLQAAASERQRFEVDRQSQEAQELLSTLDRFPSGIREVLRELAQENADLAEKWTGEDGVVNKIEAVDKKLFRAEARVAEVDSELSKLQAQVEAVGLKDSVGVLLRKQRADAPDVGMYRRFIRMRQELIGSVQLQLIQLREQRDELSSIDSLIEQSLRELSVPPSPEQEKELRRTLRELFETQRKYLDSLTSDYETYFQRLIDFDSRQQALIERTERLTTFIDERVLWIPSGGTAQPKLFLDSVDAVKWVVMPRFTSQLTRAIGAAVRSSIALNLVVLFFVLLMLVSSRRIRAKIRSLGDRARRPQCVDYAPTMEALGLSLLLALWLPALLAYTGWRLESSPEATQYVRCVAQSILAAAAVWGTLALPIALMQPDGVAVAHCAWPKDAVRSLRRHLIWLTAVAVPSVFLIFIFETRGDSVWKESIGRLTFLVLVAALTVFAHFVFRKSGPFWAIVRRDWDSKRSWVPTVVYLAAVGLPVALGVGALRGYYWTALQLSIRVHFTLVMLFVVWMTLSLSRRWLLVAQRRLALERARHKREALRELARKAAKEGDLGAEVQEPVEEEVDLESIEVQTSRLMVGAAVLAGALGVLAIWADVLPAMGILRQVELWNATQTVSVTTLDAAGIEHTLTEEQLVPVTLADLSIALLIAALALALVRNLPGVLEVSLFRRFSAGERYAYITIAKYAVALAGIVFAFDAIGIGWSSIQWLVAAVGLGLGFGLQEIFANFISGLIILFERPIRVGDTVTVGNVSGVVTKIRIRATWITAFDRKELVVPNKEFVTSQLINWSLSDPILRIQVPVGIAYGSDTKRAIQVLAQVARENEHVLEDPAPQVLFLGFGDSSLSFELRAFISGVARLFEIRHELHMAIDQAFREAGIEIAFPQRDLHLRTVPEGFQPRA